LSCRIVNEFCWVPASVMVSYSTYSSTLKMEACSSETSVDFQQITRCCIPDDRTSFSVMVSYSTYSSTLKMETCSSETSVDFQQITRCCIPRRYNFFWYSSLSSSLKRVNNKQRRAGTEQMVPVFPAIRRRAQRLSIALASDTVRFA
jgi:hypothetical protein